MASTNFQGKKILKKNPASARYGVRPDNACSEHDAYWVGYDRNIAAVRRYDSL